MIGDEAWDVDYFLHENPELKRFAFAWLTDFVGWLPMPDGGDARGGADRRLQRRDDRAAGPVPRGCATGRSSSATPTTSSPDAFGPGLPRIRDWTEAELRLRRLRHRLRPGRAGRPRRRCGAGSATAPDERVCVVTVGGSGVGDAAAAPGRSTRCRWPAGRCPDLRFVVVTGPRIDPASLPPPARRRGARLRARPAPSTSRPATSRVVQGGLTTCMELTASRRAVRLRPAAPPLRAELPRPAPARAVRRRPLPATTTTPATRTRSPPRSSAELGRDGRLPPGRDRRRRPGRRPARRPALKSAGPARWDGCRGGRRGAGDRAGVRPQRRARTTGWPGCRTWSTGWSGTGGSRSAPAYPDATEAFVAAATLADGTPAVLKVLIQRGHGAARGRRDHRAPAGRRRGLRPAAAARRGVRRDAAGAARPVAVPDRPADRAAARDPLPGRDAAVAAGPGQRPADRGGEGGQAGRVRRRRPGTGSAGPARRGRSRSRWPARPSGPPRTTRSGPCCCTATCTSGTPCEAGRRDWKLVDPDGLLAEPEADLGILMREDPPSCSPATRGSARAGWPPGPAPTRSRSGSGARSSGSSNGLLCLETGLEQNGRDSLAVSDRLANLAG